MKNLKVIAAVLSLLMAFSLAAHAQDDISVYVNGTKLAFDVAPALINDRTMVPMRKIFESVGAQIEWDGDTQSVTASKGTDTIEMQIGRSYMIKNGERTELDSAPVVIDDRTLVPVRAASEALNATVQWSEKNNAVIIMTNGVKVYEDFPMAPDYGAYMNDTYAGMEENDEGGVRYAYFYGGQESNIEGYMDALYEMSFFIADAAGDEQRYSVVYVNEKLDTALRLTIQMDGYVYIDIQAINQ